MILTYWSPGIHYSVSLYVYHINEQNNPEAVLSFMPSSRICSDVYLRLLLEGCLLKLSGV